MSRKELIKGVSAAGEIRIGDACENNLKHVNLAIAKGKLVVFAGVSVSAHGR